MSGGMDFFKKVSSNLFISATARSILFQDSSLFQCSQGEVAHSWERLK